MRLQYSMFNSKLQQIQRKQENHYKNLSRAFFHCEEAVFEIQSRAISNKDDKLNKLTTRVLVDLDLMYDHICENYHDEDSVHN